MADPPVGPDALTEDDKVLRDLYDQAHWVGSGQPLVPIRRSLLVRQFGELTTVDLIRVVQARVAYPHFHGVRFAALARCADARELLELARRYLLLKVQPARLGLCEGDERVELLLVPPPAASRIRDPRLALHQLPTPAQVNDALVRRYLP